MRPPAPLDRAPDRGKIAVQDKHHVIRQQPFGERGKAADVDEHDRDLALVALGEIDAAAAVSGEGERRQQRRHLDGALRPQLAGEPHVRRSADAAQDAAFHLGWRIEPADFAAHPDTAGRAAAAAAADMGVRDAGDPARFEHAGAGRHLDKAAVGIADADEAVTAPPEGTAKPRQQYRRDQAAKRPAEDLRNFVEGVLRRGRRQPHMGERLRESRPGRRRVRRPGARPRSRRARRAPAPAPPRRGPSGAAARTMGGSSARSAGRTSRATKRSPKSPSAARRPTANGQNKSKENRDNKDRRFRRNRRKCGCPRRDARAISEWRNRARPASIRRPAGAACAAPITPTTPARNGRGRRHKAGPSAVASTRTRRPRPEPRP